jgi:hypothetical protein
MFVIEEEERVRLNPVLNGIEINEDQYFNFDDLRIAELKEGLGIEEVM